MTVATPRRALTGAAVLAAVAAPLLAPAPAKAWCTYGDWGWRPAPVFVAPLPVPRPVYVPPPVVAYAPPPAPFYRPVWIPPHVNAWGRWAPGHWR